MTKPIGNCKYCNKPLRAFGKDHDDWQTRAYHKKCLKYNINRNYEKLKKFVELYND
jgi:hypothetical protein